VDPLAGSYYIEKLTNELEEKIKGYLREIDNLGGAIRAIEEGYIQSQINQSSYRFYEEIEKKERIIVGVNEFVTAEERVIETYQVDSAVQQLQIDRLRRLKETRDNEQVQLNLQRLREAASSTENLMPYIITAVQSYATIGEICDTLLLVFGSYNATGYF
jgi:methylmalonyl-CoA mutase N-terminal domain/subunit